MKTYEKNIENRKELVSRLEELTGQKAHYTFVPRCAYEIGAFTVEKDGSLTVTDDADESILDEKGRVDLGKLKPIVFDAAAMCYRAIGDSVGQAWGAGKKFTGQQE